MTRLTPKQEAFCLAYIETGNASEAYRRAYDASRMSATSVNRKAKDLLDNPRIRAWIKELRASAVQAAQMSLKAHLEDLKRLRDAAMRDGKYGPAVQAEIARGKAAGLYVEKTELTGRDGGPVEVLTPKLEIVLHELTDERLAAIATGRHAGDT